MNLFCEEIFLQGNLVLELSNLSKVSYRLTKYKMCYTEYSLNWNYDNNMSYTARLLLHQFGHQLYCFKLQIYSVNESNIATSKQ